MIASKMGVLGALLLGGCCGITKKCPPPVVTGDTECLANVVPASALTCATSDPEPNDSLPLAGTMDTADCMDRTVTGVLAGKDVDYFRARGGSLCSQPTLSVDADGLHACLFVQCSTGSTGITRCDDGSIVVHHPSGLLGCCLSAKGTVGLETVCGGDDRHVDVFAVVDGAPTGCVRYEVRYHL